MEDVVYIPCEDRVVIIASDSTVYCGGTWQISTDSITDTNGNPADESFESGINVIHSDGIDGIYISDFAMYDGKSRIVSPVGTKSICVRTKIMNATSEQKQADVAVLLDDDTVLAQESVRLDADSSVWIDFEICERTYHKDDLILVRVK